MASTMQKARRQDPYPWTWEIPALVAMVVLLSLAVGVQVGRSVANVAAGAGWTWPVDQATFWRSLPAVAAGDAGAGLAGAGLAASSAGSSIASPTLLWAAIGVVELSLLVIAACVGVWALRRWGPGRLKGMATRVEAEQILGLSRLRKVSPIVRPDLHAKHHAHPAQPAAVHHAGLPGPAGPEWEVGALGRGLSPGLLPQRITGRTHRERRARRVVRKP